MFVKALTLWEQACSHPSLAAPHAIQYHNCQLCQHTACGNRNPVNNYSLAGKPSTPADCTTPPPIIRDFVQTYISNQPTL